MSLIFHVKQMIIKSHFMSFKPQFKTIINSENKIKMKIIFPQNYGGLSNKRMNYSFVIKLLVKLYV